MLVRRVDSVPMPHFSSPALLLDSNFWPASSLKLLLYGYAGDFTSNNQSEFAAAGVGLEEFIAAGGRRLDIFTGSEFLCNALPEWLAPDPNHDRQRSTSLQPLFVGLQRRSTRPGQARRLGEPLFASFCLLFCLWLRGGGSRIFGADERTKFPLRHVLQHNEGLWRLRGVTGSPRHEN